MASSLHQYGVLVHGKGPPPQPVGPVEPRGLKEPEHLVKVALDESRPSERGRVNSELVLPRTEVVGVGGVGVRAVGAVASKAQSWALGSAWVVECAQSKRGRHAPRGRRGCAAARTRATRDRCGSSAPLRNPLGSARRRRPPWIKQVRINSIARTVVAHSLLTYVLTNLGRLILLVRLAAVVPALAIPARAARARARVGDARVIAGDPHLRLEENCSAAATLCAHGLHICVLASCNPRYRGRPWARRS